MSTTPEIIAKALLDSHTDSTNYDPATVGLEAMNIVSDEINNEIVKVVKEDYFWDRLLVDSVLNQSEYNITTWTVTWDSVSTVVNIKKASKLFVKYDSNDDYYTKLKYVDPSSLDDDMDYYADTQSKTNPFYYIQDRSVFIYPKPDIAVVSWLKMTVIYTPPKVTYTGAWSAESWLPLQPDKHYIYSLGIQEHIFRSQWLINEAENIRGRFNIELNKLTWNLKTRKTWPIKRTFKNNLNSYR